MNSKIHKSRDKIYSQPRSNSAHKQQYKRYHLQQLTAKAQPLHIYQMPQLHKLRQNFKKQIDNPIHTLINMHFTKTAQRCLTHNNIITLYCLNERKPLCVTCMYQNNLHKKHKVIPLNRANQQLQQQITSYINVVNKELGKTNKIMNQSHVYLKRVERQFPDLIAGVDHFYINLHQMLNEKKNQQLQHIQQTWTRLRLEYRSVSKELENINVYIMQKISQIKLRGGQENLLLNRNIASHLVNLSKIIPENICQYQQNSYDSELKKFQEVRTIINNKLVFTSPYQQKILRNHSRKPSTRNSQTTSPKPKANNNNRSRSNSNIKSSTKLQHKKNQLQKSPTFGKSPTKTSSFKRSGQSLERG